MGGDHIVAAGVPRWNSLESTIVVQNTIAMPLMYAL
jgi:hypothetical protein